MLFNVFQGGLFDLYGSEDAARAKVREAVEAGSFAHQWMVEAINPGHVFEITNYAGMVAPEQMPEVLWRGARPYSGSVGDVILSGDHDRGWLVLPVGFAELDRDFVRWFETKVSQCMLIGRAL